MIDMNLWNKRDLHQPPINTYKTTNKDVDIQHMANVFKEAKSFIDNNKYFVTEHAVLSRIIYRMKMKFRSSKDFKTIERLKKALDRLFEINLSTDLQNFIDLIPLRYRSETYLPTKNLLDYILIRMQGMVKLLERIVETAKIAVPLLEDRLHIGHFWQLAFILYAVISRIYVLAKHSANHICESYNKIRPFSKKLDNTSKSLVPDNQILPLDLKEWLNVDWLDLDDEVQIIEDDSRMPGILDFFNLIDDDDEDVEFCDEYFLLDSDGDDNHDDIYDGQSNRKISNKTKDGSDPRLEADEDIEIIDIINGTVKKLDKIVPTKSKRTKNILFPGFEDEDKGEVIEISDLSLIDNPRKDTCGQNDNNEKNSLDASIVSISDINSDASETEGITINDESIICLSRANKMSSEKNTDNDLVISETEVDSIPKKKRKKKLKDHGKVVKNTTKRKRDAKKKLEASYTMSNLDGVVPESGELSERRKFISGQSTIENSVQNAIQKKKLKKTSVKKQNINFNFQERSDHRSGAASEKNNKKKNKRKINIFDAEQNTSTERPIMTIPSSVRIQYPSRVDNSSNTINSNQNGPNKKFKKKIRNLSENTQNVDSTFQRSGEEVTTTFETTGKKINKQNKKKRKKKLLTEGQSKAKENQTLDIPRTAKIGNTSSDKNLPTSLKTKQLSRTAALRRIAKRKAKSARKQKKLGESKLRTSKLSKSQVQKMKKFLKKKITKPYS